MSESETRAEYIDPKLKASGWGEVEESKVLREFRITDGRIQTGGMRGKPEVADYILVYKNRKIGVIEAKAENLAINNSRLSLIPLIRANSRIMKPCLFAGWRGHSARMVE